VGAVADGQDALGRRLRRRRAEIGLTQEQLAEITGLSVRTISNIERCSTARPHRSSVSLLLDALELGQLEPVWPGSAQEPPGDSGVLPALVVPRQLPAAIAGFAGRSDELNTLNRLLDLMSGHSGAVVVAIISGTAGVGKTALAIRWAHQVASLFPDGQLYIDLRGFGPSGPPAAAADAVGCLLEALGVPAARIPARTDARTGLYRSLLADKRMLVVMDNASDTAQARALLPGSPGSLVLITSRSQLSGLDVTEGAHRLPLDVLTDAEALDLLTLRLGTERVTAEPGATTALIELTARLPLALSIAAARIAAYPAYPLSALVAELRDARSRLHVLDHGDVSADVRAAFSWSYHRLTDTTAQIFRLLSIHSGPDVTAAAIASLAGVTPLAARRALADLMTGGLVSEPVPGRFTCHDLLRSYAAELADGDAETARRQARDRGLDHYLHSAHAAMLLLDGGQDPLPLPSACPGVRVEELCTVSQALAWFTAEHAVLLAAIGEAARTMSDIHAWLLPATMAAYLSRSGHWHEWAASQRAALAAARRLGDDFAQARCHRCLGYAYARLRDFSDARDHLRHALRLFTCLGDQIGQGHTHCAFAVLLGQQQQHRQALHHARRAKRLFAAVDHRLGQAVALHEMGWDYLQLGEQDNTVICCQQALQLCHQVSNRALTGATWNTLGQAHHQCGRPADAITCYRQAISEYRQVSHRWGEGAVLTCLGDIQHSIGDLRAATSSWQQALDILTDLHHRDADSVRARLRQSG
jgi:tetratricopeptide (TPR) repeat protein